MTLPDSRYRATGRLLMCTSNGRRGSERKGGTRCEGGEGRGGKGGVGKEREGEVRGRTGLDGDGRG